MIDDVSMARRLVDPLDPSFRQSCVFYSARPNVLSLTLHLPDSPGAHSVPLGTFDLWIAGKFHSRLGRPSLSAWCMELVHLVP